MVRVRARIWVGAYFLRVLGQIRIQVGGIRAKLVRVRIQCLGGA